MEWNGMEWNWIELEKLSGIAWTATGRKLEHVGHDHTHRTSRRNGWPRGFGELNPEYLFPSQWIVVIAPTYSLPPRCDYPFTLHQYVTEPIWYMTLHFQDRHGVASLRHRNSTEITVLMCELESHPVLFSCLVWQNIRCDLEHRWSWRNKNNLRRTG